MLAALVGAIILAALALGVAATGPFSAANAGLLGAPAGNEAELTPTPASAVSMAKST